MKIQAKDLKIGMKVRDGYLTIDVEEIEKGILKNGKETITVHGKGTRKHTGSGLVSNYKKTYLTFKALTKVNAY